MKVFDLPCENNTQLYGDLIGPQSSAITLVWSPPVSEASRFCFGAITYLGWRKNIRLDAVLQSKGPHISVWLLGRTPLVFLCIWNAFMHQCHIEYKYNKTSVQNLSCLTQKQQIAYLVWMYYTANNFSGPSTSTTNESLLGTSFRVQYSECDNSEIIVCNLCLTQNSSSKLKAYDLIKQ